MTAPAAAHKAGVPPRRDLPAETFYAGRWQFVTGVADAAGLPPPDRPELALIGRSNVGKSSLLNALTGHKALARISRTPGRTREMNFFTPPDSSLYLVDMPGYGYARRSQGARAQWSKISEAYLCGRAALKSVFLLVDARLGLKPSDHALMDLMGGAGVAHQIVLTKMDELKAADQTRRMQSVEAQAVRHAAARREVMAVSSRSGEGIAPLRAAMTALAQTAGMDYKNPAPAHNPDRGRS